ncbi:MAG: Tfp pilus assembly protein FimT/FimU [Candidatus Berkiella sp.]
MLSSIKAANGYSLLEMMLVLIITAILGVVGFSFSSTYSRFNAHTVSDEIYTLLNAAASFTRQSRQSVLVICDVEQHAMTVMRLDPLTKVLHKIKHIDVVSISPSLKMVCPQQVQFNPDGSVLILDKNKDKQEIEYRIGGQVISVDGQTSYVY